jgi:hypothetical protein
MERREPVDSEAGRPWRKAIDYEVRRSERREENVQALQHSNAPAEDLFRG